MKADVILNGSIRVVLIPENDMEKLALEQICKQEVDVTLIDKQTQILDKVIHDGLIVKPKTKSST
jgi:hypothetical protein